MHFINTPLGLAGQAYDGKCRSYDPGHALHYIQLRKASESGRAPAVWVGIESPVTVKFSIGGELMTLFSHHSGTIQDLITIHADSNLVWVEEFRVLFIESSSAGGFAFNLSRQPIAACAE